MNSNVGVRAAVGSGPTAATQAEAGGLFRPGTHGTKASSARTTSAFGSSVVACAKGCFRGKHR